MSGLRAWAVVCRDEERRHGEALSFGEEFTKRHAKFYDRTPHYLNACGPHTVVELGPIEPEVVICAAVKSEDGAIFRGHRHGDALRWVIARRLSKDTAQKQKTSIYHGGVPSVQGFITSRNRFVDRHEAYQLQIAAGIESVAEGGYRGEELFSEDLY